MKTFEVTVSYRPRKEPSPRNVWFRPIKASSARVALNYGIQAGQHQKYYTDSEILGASVRELTGKRCKACGDGVTETGACAGCSYTEDGCICGLKRAS